MSPLEEQASSCQSMAIKINDEFDQMSKLLNKWLACDRADESNHWMYYKLQDWLKKLDDQVNLYDEEVTEVELLEGLQEKGDIVFN